MDFDGDDILDLISGSYSSRLGQPAAIYLFRGLGKGRFEGRQTILTKGGEPVSAGSAPDAHPDTRNFRRASATEPAPHGFVWVFLRR